MTRVLPRDALACCVTASRCSGFTHGGRRQRWSITRPSGTSTPLAATQATRWIPRNVPLSLMVTCVSRSLADRQRWQPDSSSTTTLDVQRGLATRSAQNCGSNGRCTLTWEGYMNAWHLVKDGEEE